MFYRFNKQTLVWEKDKKRATLITSLFFISCFFSFLFGQYHRVETIDEIFQRAVSSIVFDLPKDMNVEYVDSLFKDYEMRANIYLSQEKFKNSPIKGFMLSTCAKDAYLMTGIFLPVELALSQAQLESSMGTKGRSPDTNPFNVGEYDSSTVLRFNNTYEGVRAYYKYMTRNYLKCRPVDLLFKNFTNCSGYRYATAPEYEKNLSRLYYNIKNYIDKNK
jgi:hypothetical protein